MASTAGTSANGTSVGKAAPVDITSPEQFTSLMEADLNRVTLLNFWAPWAEPCKQMNEVVQELAAKYPQIAVLNVSRGRCAILLQPKREGPILAV